MEPRRVVRTRVSAGEDGWVFGSGYLVAPGRVLTARHVLAVPEASPALGGACQVRRYPCGPAEDWLAARVRWLHPSGDAAVVAVDGFDDQLAALRWGRVEGTEPVGWTAMGYPVAGLGTDDRVEEQVFGTVAPQSTASVGFLALTVTSRGARADDSGASGWAGLSGAAVFSGDVLVGVMLADPARWTGSLQAVRVSRLVDEPGFAPAVEAPGDLVLVAAAPDAAGAQAAASAVDGGLRVVGDRVSAGVETWRDRDELRAELRAALVAPGGARILCVTGRRGIGKSATVTKVVAEFERPDPVRHPLDDLDGIVYASSTPTSPLSLARVFDGMTRLLPETAADRLRGRWERSGADALPDLWSALRARRCVVVLDNLDTLQDPATGQLLEDSLVRLLESAARTPYPQRVVTTSQRGLDLPADLVAQVRELRMEDGLGAADAVSLLRSINPLPERTDDEVARVVGRLFGVPRGIELLATAIRTDPFLFDTVLDSEDSLDGLMAQLVSRAFQSLGDPGRHVVQLLALAELPLPEPEVAGLLEGLIPTDRARSALRALVRSREIGFDPRARTVRLHPLDADWVRHRLLEEPELQVALDRRLADWWAGQAAPLEEWRVLADARPRRREYVHRWRAGDPVGGLRALAEAAKFLVRKGESAALRSALSAGEAVAREGEGRRYLEQLRFLVEFFAGSLERAEAALLAARAASGDADRDAVDQLDLDLGMLQRHRGNDSGAAQTLETLLGRAGVDLEVRLEAMFELGLSYCYQRNWARADEVAGELAAAVTDEHPGFRASPYDVWALAHLGMKDYAAALTAADRAIAYYLDSPRQDDTAYLYNIRGLVHMDTGDLERAEAELQMGLRTAREYRIDRIEGICATNLAWTLLRGGRCADAAEAAQRGAERLRSIGASEAETAEALVPVAEGPRSSSSEVLAVLQRAAAASWSNPDFYTPDPEVLAHMAGELTGAGNSA